MSIKSLPCAFVVLLLVIVVGCVPSWNPLFTEKDLVFEPKLVGTWRGEEDSIWEFEKDGEKHYKLSYSDKHGKSVANFVAFLLKIEGRQFLNLFIDDGYGKDLQMNALASMTLVPVHLFLRVDEIGESVKMAMVDAQWLHKHLKQNPKAVAHLSHPNRDLLTADTKELQAFVMKHVEGKGLFAEPFTLKRSK